MTSICREYRLSKMDGLHNLKIVESVVPKPGPFEVLVKVHAVSLNTRDLIIGQGGLQFGENFVELPAFHLNLKENLIPGSDMAGEVVEVGDHVRRFRQSDRVCANLILDHIAGDPTPETQRSGLSGEIDGVLAEYRVFPEHSLVHIPEKLSYEEASTLPCAGVASYNALMGSTPVKGGDFVLIQGTGGVSIFSLQFAVSSGATVIITSSSDQKLEVARSMGAKHVINYKKTPDWPKEVLKITRGRGVDHVVELGGPGTWINSLESLRYGGHLHVVGVTAPPGDISMMVMHMIQKAIHMHGVQAGSRVQFEEMNRLIEATDIKPKIEKVFPFEEARKAFEYLASGVHVGKVVIKVADD